MIKARSLTALNAHPLKLSQTISLGHKLMRAAKLHPHFFGNNTLLQNAEYLALFALNREYNPANPSYTDFELSPSQYQKIMALFERRIKEKLPVEYITNEAFYLERKFYVNEHVLVPRSLMHYRFAEFLADINWQNYRVLDLCTGSGCIGVTLAIMQPNITVDLADISSAALNVARANIVRHKMEERVQCIQSDLFNNIRGKYDLIITNPPYVSAKDYKKVPAEFKHEPKIALECGNNGLEIIDRILAESKEFLNPQGKLIAEVGYATASKLKRKYKHLPLQWYTYQKPGKQGFFDKYIAPLVAMHGVFGLVYT